MHCGVRLSLAGQSVMDVNSYVSRLRENLDTNVCLSFCVSVFLCVCLSVYLSVCLFRFVFLEKTKTIKDFHDFGFIGALFYSLAAP